MAEKRQREAEEHRTHEEERSSEPTNGDRQKQQRPKVPLLCGGKDPTLAERFEEELHGS